jgi:hypothetical protein
MSDQYLRVCVMLQQYIPCFCLFLLLLVWPTCRVHPQRLLLLIRLHPLMLYVVLAV